MWISGAPAGEAAHHCYCGNRRCFGAQPRQEVTWRQVLQNPPPPTLFWIPSHITSHHPAPCPFLIDYAPSPLPLDGISERDAVLPSWFTEES